MVRITCPHCGAKIELIKFGFAWVGVCCRGVIYNDYELPENYTEEGEHENRTKEEQ